MNSPTSGDHLNWRALAEELAEGHRVRNEAHDVCLYVNRREARGILAALRYAAVSEPNHRWVGVYQNGDHKTGTVTAAELLEFIAYNTTMRPGRALVIDDVLVYTGINVSVESVNAAKAKANVGARCKKEPT